MDYDAVQHVYKVTEALHYEHTTSCSGYQGLLKVGKIGVRTHRTAGFLSVRSCHDLLESG